MLFPVKTGDNIAKYFGLDYVRKMSMLDGMIDTAHPQNCPFDKAVVKVSGSGATKTIEASFYKGVEGRDDTANDKRLFASYGEIAKSDTYSRVKLNDIIEEIVACLRADLRMSYRQIIVSKSENDPTLYTNFKHISTVVLGIIMAFNEIEYKNPINLSIDRVLNDYLLSISVDTNTFKFGEGLHDVCELYPQVAMRLSYISSLCDDKGIEYSYHVKPSSVGATFVINNMVNDTGKFSFFPFGEGERDFASYIIGLFAYESLSDTEEGEEEGE